jgi:hypothetical protein
VEGCRRKRPACWIPGAQTHRSVDTVQGTYCQVDDAGAAVLDRSVPMMPPRRSSYRHHIDCARLLHRTTAGSESGWGRLPAPLASDWECPDFGRPQIVIILKSPARSSRRRSRPVTRQEFRAPSTWGSAPSATAFRARGKGTLLQIPAEDLRLLSRRATVGVAFRPLAGHRFAPKSLTPHPSRAGRPRRGGG